MDLEERLQTAIQAESHRPVDVVQAVDRLESVEDTDGEIDGEIDGENDEERDDKEGVDAQKCLSCSNRMGR